jgi:hypothetical protein
MSFACTSGLFATHRSHAKFDTVCKSGSLAFGSVPEAKYFDRVDAALFPTSSAFVEP